MPPTLPRTGRGPRFFPAGRRPAAGGSAAADPWGIDDVLPEHGVKAGFCPGHVLPGRADPRRRPRKAELRRQIKEEHAVAGLKPQGQSPQVVAVYDPFVKSQQAIMPAVKFLVRGRRPVRPVKEHVQIVQREARLIPQLAGEGAFPGARAADHDDFLHPILSPFSWPILRASPQH